MIEKKIVSAFKTINTETNIPLTNIRVMLIIVDNKLDIAILNGGNFVEKTTIEKIISLSAMEKLLVSYEKITDNLLEKLKKIFEKNNISEQGNVRIYLSGEVPKYHLFDFATPVKNIEHQEILN